MKINFNCYKVLGIQNFSQKEEVKKAYRKLAMIHHPDRGGDGERIKIINVAYETLNKEKNKYDDWLRQQLQPQLPSFTIIIDRGTNNDWSSTDSYMNDSTWWNII